uniref:Uncharacterized protein n=1 Tax=Panagrolaimus sp. PS1159 TaxID=55785 RepID=A0AC35FF31_9BILA
MNASLYTGPVELSFSSSNSSRKSNQDEENLIISNDSSSIDNKTDKETDIVRVELENLLYSLQPRQPLVPYPLSSSEEI